MCLAVVHGQVLNQITHTVIRVFVAGLLSTLALATNLLVLVVLVFLVLALVLAQDGRYTHYHFADAINTHRNGLVIVALSNEIIGNCLNQRVDNLRWH